MKGVYCIMWNFIEDCICSECGKTFKQSLLSMCHNSVCTKCRCKLFNKQYGRLIMGKDCNGIVRYQNK